MSLKERDPKCAVNLGEPTVDRDSLDFTEYYIYWAILDVSIFVVIVVGNILTILAVRTTRKLREVTSNTFVLNLAISDLMVGLSIAYQFAFYIYKHLGDRETPCVMRFVLYILACSLSMYSLIAIAIDRYIAVIHPLKYARSITKTTVNIMIVVGWFGAIVISTIPIYWNNFGSVLHCEFENILPRYYTVGILCPLICIIWIGLLLLYWRIWRAGRIHTRRLREIGFVDPALDDCKGSKVVLSILGCFSICWLPYLIIVCTTLFRFSPTGYIYKSLIALAMSNSGINPFIYAWKSKQFRKAFYELLCFKTNNRKDNNTSLNDNLERENQSTKREIG